MKSQANEENKGFSSVTIKKKKSLRG